MTEIIIKVITNWCPYDKGYVVYRPLALCYKIHEDEVAQAQAKLTCQDEGGILAMVKDETTFNHLYDFLRASSTIRQKHFQIGADDIAVEGSLRWADGSPVTWTNWAQGEPSHDTERCTSMAWFYYFKWNDIPCSHPVGFLCQIIKP
ncbi:collectin-10-like isoform X2 [Gigantopelta aegis]|uniref:collectin-10-like isoform X2 n=1 Tax=Gigantopelta aegis TaxID=1735272 RepID=UPI001B88B074|nr:collectin-10-like isoform X2 [Gigantopelta aegis]